MQRGSTNYQLPAVDLAWTRSVELGADIFFFGRRTHVAGHSSPAAQRLIDRGAVLIGTLRFRASPASEPRPRVVRRLSDETALRRFGTPPPLPS